MSAHDDERIATLEAVIAAQEEQITHLRKALEIRQVRGQLQDMQALRASRPAASPLREAAERVLREWDDDGVSSLDGAIDALRAALAVPALSRERLLAGLRRLCEYQRQISEDVSRNRGDDLDQLINEREQQIRSLLDAVCGPEASHG